MHLQHNPTQSLEGTKDSGGVDHETLDMLTADLEIITPLSGQSGRMLKFETQPNLPQAGLGAARIKW